MIINQISYNNDTSSNIISKNILYNKIGYIDGNKILGNAPMTIDNNIDSRITVSLSTSNAIIKSICYGNGKLVGVASNATSKIAVYSEDGFNWIETSLPTTAYWNYVCYGDGKFVALPYADYTTSQVTTNKAAYSEDGINWTQVTLPVSAYWTSICYGNGKFVAVSGKSGNSNIALYSTDGITWTKSTLPASLMWYSVCYGNGKFIALAAGGYSSSGATATTIAAYSNDGITWIKITANINANWYGIAYGNGVFVATIRINNIYKAAYSEDGVNWTQVTLPVSGNWDTVCYGDGKFVIMQTRTSNYALYSINGISWDSKPIPNTSLNSLCYANMEFVFVDGYNNIYHSKDGTVWNHFIYHEYYKFLEDNIIISTNDRYKAILKKIDNLQWVESSLKENVNNTISVETIYFGDGKYFAFNTSLSNYYIYSTDGLHWIKYATLPATLKWWSMTYGANKFVIVAYGTSGTNNLTNKAAYSEDGVNWTQVTLPVSGNWESVCYGKDKFVAGGNGYGHVYSEDGINWTFVKYPWTIDGGRSKLHHIVYGNGKFVGLIDSGNDKYCYSTDGIIWTQTTLPASAYWTSICYGNGKFIAIANDSNIAAYSEDGINWTQITMPTSAYWYSICYGGGKFVAGAKSNGIAAYSEDGINWTLFSNINAFTNKNSICAGNNKFVVITNSSDVFHYSYFNKYELEMLN